MGKRFLTDRRRAKAAEYARLFRKDFDIESEVSEVPVNIVTGTLETASFAKVADCTIEGSLKVGPGSTLIGCVIPKGISVEVSSCCMLVGVRFSLNDTSSTGKGTVQIGSGCFLLYCGIKVGNYVQIGNELTAIESHMFGDVVIGNKAIMWKSTITAFASEIKDDAVILGSDLTLRMVNIRDGLTVSSYNDIVSTDTLQWALSENAAECIRVHRSTAFELNGTHNYVNCGNGLSLFAYGSLSLQDGGDIGNNVTIINMDDRSTSNVVPAVELQKVSAKDNSNMVLGKRMTVYGSRVRLPTVELTIGNSASVLLTGALARTWGHYFGKMSIKDHSTVNL